MVGWGKNIRWLGPKTKCLQYLITSCKTARPKLEGRPTIQWRAVRPQEGNAHPAVT